MNASPTTAAQRDRWRRYGVFAAGVAERVRHGASYNPLSERTVQDPYPVSVTAYMEPFRVRLKGATSCSG